jgi:hypothetical protein
MTTVRARSGWVAVLAAAAIIAACGAEKRGATPPDDEPLHFGAENLPDPQWKGSIYDALDDDERAAVERSGMSGVDEPPARQAQSAPPDGQSRSDKAGRMAISVLTVAVSAAAAAAPFLLF